MQPDLIRTADKRVRVTSLRKKKVSLKVRYTVALLHSPNFLLILVKASKHRGTSSYRGGSEMSTAELFAHNLRVGQEDVKLLPPPIAMSGRVGENL